MVKKILHSLLIPNDFGPELSDINNKTFQWTIDVRLQPDGPARGSITHYSIGDKAYGNIILVPGLGSNTNIEPLMRAINYWALTHRHNIYCVNSFLGDFREKLSVEEASQNTYQEFVNLMNMSLDIIEKHTAGTWTCLVGHSAGATATIETFNRRILANKKPRVRAAVLLAPPMLQKHADILTTIYRQFYRLTDLSDYEFNHRPMQIFSPHDFDTGNGVRYVCVMPQFMNDMVSQPLRPDLMNEWGIPVTIVAAARDRKVPASDLREVYDQISQLSNGDLFKFVEFKNSKHSFIDQHKHWDDVLKLIKSQHIPKNRQK